jgi:hypothetical protein
MVKATFARPFSVTPRSDGSRAGPSAGFLVNGSEFGWLVVISLLLRRWFLPGVECGAVMVWVEGVELLDEPGVGPALGVVAVPAGIDDIQIPPSPRAGRRRRRGRRAFALAALAAQTR